MYKTVLLALILLVATPANAQDFSYSVTAVDATTKEPIKNIRIVPTSYRPNARTVTWQSQYLKDFKESPALFTLKRGWEQTLLRVESDGYESAISDPIKRKKNGTLNIELKPDVGWSGRVHTPDGKPAANSQVAVCTWTNEVTVENGELRYGSHAQKLRPMASTNADGRFRIPSEVDTWVLILAHPSGYRELTNQEFKNGDNIHLLPWGRLEGDFIVGAPPYAGFPINVGAGRGDVEVVLHYNNQTIETDKDGKFVFETLPPVEMYVQPQYKFHGNTHSLFHFSGLTQILAGETTRISIPRIGQTVIGKVTLPKDCPYLIEELDIKLKVTLKPPQVYGFGQEDTGLFEAYHKFITSDQSRPFRRDNISVDANGKFRIPELPESTYILQAFAYQRGEMEKPRIPYAIISTRLNIPPKKKDQKVDLNLMEMDINPKFQN